MASETAPLLPRVNPAPEVHGVQPQGPNDIGVVNEDDDDVVVDDRGSRCGVNNIVAFYAAVLIIAVIMLLTNPVGSLVPGWKHRGQSPTLTIDERVAEILSNTPLIDGHNDLAIFIRYFYNNHIYNETFQKQFAAGGMPMHVDLPRLKEGKVGGAFWAAFAPCPANGSDFSDENYASTVAFTFNQIDLLRRLQALYPTHFSPSPNSTTALSHFHAQRLISPLAIEGLHQIGNSPSTLRAYHALGVRYATLTHNCHNAYADAALTEGPGGRVSKARPHWHGVSPAGRALIAEMNRLGVLVDLSHTSHATMLDVLGGGSSSDSTGSPWPGSAAPPIFSHSSAYALCPHPRNVRDDVLQLIQQRRGVVMVNFSPDFISCVAATPPRADGLPDFYAPNATLSHVADHVEYIGRLIGYAHVGLGSDFDGIAHTPRGLEDVSRFPALVAELLRRGVADKDVALVVGGNVLRVWAEVDEVALRMQGAGVEPLEDDLPGLSD